MLQRRRPRPSPQAPHPAARAHRARPDRVPLIRAPPARAHRDQARPAEVGGTRAYGATHRWPSLEALLTPLQIKGPRAGLRPAGLRGLRAEPVSAVFCRAAVPSISHIIDRSVRSAPIPAYRVVHNLLTAPAGTPSWLPTVTRRDRSGGRGGMFQQVRRAGRVGADARRTGSTRRFVRCTGSWGRMSCDLQIQTNVGCPGGRDDGAGDGGLHGCRSRGRTSRSGP